MIDKCPKCARKLDKKMKKCPSCGYFLINKKEKKPENHTQRLSDENNKTDELKNDSIEWSQFKDMSIGNVMKMFNSLQEDELEENLENTKQIAKDTSDTLASGEENSDVASSKKLTIEQKEATDKFVTEVPASISEQKISNEINEDKTNLVVDKEKKSLKQSADKSHIHSEKKVETEKTSIKQKTEKFYGPNPVSAVSDDKTSNKKEKNKKTAIEMDSAPIFFKEDDELPENNQAKDVFLPTDTFNEKKTDSNVESKIGDEIVTAEKTDAVVSSKKDSSFKETTQQKAVEKPLVTPAKKNYKKISIVLVASVCLVGGVWGYSQIKNRQSTQIQAAKKAEKQEALAQKIKTNLEAYFTDDQQKYIKTDKVDVELTDIKKDLETLSDKKNYKELYIMYDAIEKKQAAIKQVNALFVAPHVVEDTLVDVVIKEDKPIEIDLYEEKDEFDKLINQAIKNAQEQYATLETAKQSIDVFYINNELNEQLTRESYTTAKNNVEKIKNEKLRVSLENILKQADSLLTEQETAVAVQTVPEAQTNNSIATVDETEQAFVYAEPDATTFSKPNADGVYTDPVYPVVASDVADTGNPAWVWAAGVQEKVIETCKQRGYITEGSYSLQPACIINGQGYYNLYGANNQYLVTINNKTGWFKGNASRNAAKNTNVAMN